MKVSEAIEKCSQLKQRIAELEAEKTAIEEKIKRYMQAKSMKKVNTDTMCLQYVQVDKLIYSVNNLRNTLSSEMFMQLTDKAYSVDGAALTELLEENPKLKSKLDKIISVDYVPNKNKIEKAFRENKISEKDVLKFTTVKSSAYLKYKDNTKENE